MNNKESKTTLFWWISMTVAVGFLVFMVAFMVRSIANILREPAPPPLTVVAPTETPSQPEPPFPEAAAAPQPQKQQPHKNNITINFEQNIRAEQERKQSYQFLREQAKAHPGQLGTLTEKEIQKLEKEEVTGDSGYP